MTQGPTGAIIQDICDLQWNAGVHHVDLQQNAGIHHNEMHNARVHTEKYNKAVQENTNTPGVFRKKM